MNTLPLVIALIALAATPSWATVMDPSGAAVSQVGPALFQTHSLSARQDGHRLIITARTNYRPLPEYNAADLKIDLGGSTVAVKLSGPRRGDLLLNPHWFTSEMFALSNIPHGRQLDGSYIPVQARGGTCIGHADVIETMDGYQITVPLENFPGSGRQKITITWGTAFCGNSLAETSTEISLAPGPAAYGGPMPDSPGFTTNMQPVAAVAPYYRIMAGTGWPIGPGDCPIYGDDIIYPPVPPTPPCPPVPPVPLPSSILLLLTGLVRLAMKGLPQ